MIVKSFVLLFAFFTSAIAGSQFQYTYNSKISGWLKLHKPATWIDASILCEIEGAELAFPKTSVSRDAIRDYVSSMDQSVSTIFAGVHAEYATAKGVFLSKMPVTLEPDTSIDYQKFKNCIAWALQNATVKSVRCNETMPYVCYKEVLMLQVTSCGTLDSGYVYEERSGSCYKFHRQSQIWSQAYMTCKAEGAYLAIINSGLESVILKELFTKNENSSFPGTTNADYSFIGIRDWLDGESWKTVKDQSLKNVGFSVWDSGEPNHLYGGIENCITVSKSGTYNDFNCMWPLSFICEKEPLRDDILDVLW